VDRFLDLMLSAAGIALGTSMMTFLEIARPEANGGMLIRRTPSCGTGRLTPSSEPKPVRVRLQFPGGVDRPPGPCRSLLPLTRIPSTWSMARKIGTRDRRKVMRVSD
jgi:hypothetical protein